MPNLRQIDNEVFFRGEIWGLVNSGKVCDGMCRQPLTKRASIQKTSVLSGISFT
jgi:hypothetical protein